MEMLVKESLNEKQYSKHFNVQLSIEVDKSIELWDFKTLEHFVKEAIEQYSNGELYVADVYVS